MATAQTGLQTGQGPLGQAFRQLMSYGGQPDLNYDEVNALLQNFGGLQLPREAHPMGLFEETAWGARHPRLSGGLDNALIALANMGEPSPTIGGNISNAARGLMSIGPTRRMQQLAPIEATLGMAQQLGQLQNLQSLMDVHAAQAKWFSERGDVELAKAASRQAAALSRAQMQASDPRRAMVSKDGVVLMPEFDEDGKPIWVPHPEMDPKEIHRNRIINSIFGGGVEGQIIAGKVLSEHGLPPNLDNLYAKENAAWWNAANDLLERHKSLGPSIGAGSAGERQLRSEWFQTQNKIFKDILEGGTTAKIREDRIDAEVARLMREDPELQKLPPGKRFTEAKKRAEANARAHRGRLESLRSEFMSRVFANPDAAMRTDAMEFLRSRGYNPETDSFEQTTPAPRLGPNLAPAAPSAPKKKPLPF